MVRHENGRTGAQQATGTEPRSRAGVTNSPPSTRHVAVHLPAHPAISRTAFRSRSAMTYRADNRAVQWHLSDGTKPTGPTPPAETTHYKYNNE